MKSINRIKCIGLVPLLVLLCGCNASEEPGFPYDANTGKSAFRFEFNDMNNTAPSFAASLCIPDGDSPSDNEIEAGPESYGSAAFFDLKNKKTVYSRNAYTAFYPASLTKIMTALVAMENCDMDKILTADSSCVMTDNDVQKISLKEGDTMTLDQALHILLIYSANDVANLIAVNVGGSVEGFTTLMNAEAERLGATNTHFINPHGLHDENHVTTAYDMYLIFNEAIKYGKFIEIIGQAEYSTVYKSALGEPVEFSCKSTDRYLNGRVSAPTQVNVIGGKTGTTQAAGANLVLLTKDSSGNPYISIVMRAKNAEVLYQKMNSMLDLTG
ncbi:MAG: serine hydrolase [Lachnospiraceae bacterium]|nr:serine hydrolase [Lachnospiraceae bacterium]